MSDDAIEGEQSMHTLSREVVMTRVVALRPDDEGGLESDPDLGENLLDYEERATIECSCGEAFRKESTALEHLREMREEQ